MNRTTDDSTAIRSIVRDLDVNLMVEAGAGTGKTYALVSRVVALVKSGVPMQNIVAITFTEAAAAELSERIRSRMEQLLDADYRATDADPLALDGDERVEWTDGELARLSEAIAELDRASIQTIHSFAGQLLRQRPMDAGLPPGWSQWDDLLASQDFDERWGEWLEWALGDGPTVDAELQRILAQMLRTGNTLAHVSELAEACSGHYDKLVDVDHLSGIDLVEIADTTLSSLRELAAECTNDSDALYRQLAGAIDTVQAVADATDDPVAASDALRNGTPVDFSGNVGSKGNWKIETRDVRSELRACGAELGQVVHASLLQPLFKNLRRRFAVEYAADRKADGVVSFDDLLVWTRDLLRDREASRRYFRERFTHILIDEFQDTDPLQAEIAFYIAAAADAPVGEQPWHSLPLEPGRLFIVGDTKQSIYRFRGADLTVVQQARQSGRLASATLSENRRSQEAILDWVNGVYGSVMGNDTSGLQAEYVPLQPNAGTQQGDTAAQVRVFGEAADARADDVRRAEAEDIARLISAYASEGDHRLSVSDRELKQLRPARLGDVCILIRTRTGLGILERSLEDAGIPYRIEGGSLMFNTQEVQDLLNCLRAIDNPADEVSVVAALRSPAFACSDVDLLNWKDGGGIWNYLDVRDDRGSSPVGDGMAALLDYHGRRHGISVTRLITEFVRDHRLEELDLAEYRPREIWRRRQFLIEQARNREGGGGTDDGATTSSLYEFIKWAELQQDNANRISEIPVPETDDDAVRIMTMHSSKGLEFPIVVLLDVDYAPRSRTPNMLIDSATGELAVSIGSKSANTRIQTPAYEGLAELEDAHQTAEEVRLGYVAATRARDHLLVSLHRQLRTDGSFQNVVIETIVEQFDSLPHTVVEPMTQLPPPAPTEPAITEPVALTYDVEGWHQGRQTSIANRSTPQAVTATRIARQANSIDGGGLAAGDVVIEDKDAEADEEQPWRAGRGGTAFGTALHAALQEAVGHVLSELPVSDEQSLERLHHRLDSEIDRLAAWQADEEGVHGSADDIASLARVAVRHESVVSALMSASLWPEIPVAGAVETSRGPVVIEGIIDLLYLDHDGELVILDYKSDDVEDDAAIERTMERYRWQGASYAVAVEKATGRRVKAVEFLFVRRNRLATIGNLRALMEQLPDHIA